MNRRLFFPFFHANNLTMSRKPQRGYYVRGHFVAEGSELDLALKREGKWDAEFSKTDRKRQSEELQELGEELLTLRASLLDGLQLPQTLLDALAEAGRIRDFEGRRRQMQYVGKLMRRLDEEEVEAIRAALQLQKSGHAANVMQLHQTEQWRERLTPEQYHILRQAGTERPFSSPLNQEKRAGTFACAGCQLPFSFT